MASFLNPTADTERRSGTAEVGSGVFERIEAWRARRRQAARIAFELNCYSERELADLGLTRSDIPLVARGDFRRS